VYGEEFTISATYKNIGRATVTVFLESVYLSGWRAAASIADATAGNFEASFEGGAIVPVPLGERPERPTILRPEESVTDLSAFTVFVRRNRNRPALPFAIDPGSHYLKLTTSLRVRSGVISDAARPPRRQPRLSEWSSLTAANLLPITIASQPTLVDCDRSFSR
jgi:hypothetical protein